MRQQTTDRIFMIRPAAFEMNNQTAVNNHYQKPNAVFSPEEIKTKSLKEFDDFVAKLQEKGIHVDIIQDSKTPHTPDAIFPNNWVSLHQDGTIGLYPMFAHNRRDERNKGILEHLQQLGFQHTKILDFTDTESSGLFLEGTGSLVLDRVNKIAYASLSKRTHPEMVKRFCKNFNYTAVSFTAFQTVSNRRVPIYHTNVMMSIGTKLAIVCFDCIDNFGERQAVKKSLFESGKITIDISEAQVNSFAGNMLELKNKTGKAFMIMSSQAYESLEAAQIEVIEKHTEIIHSPLEVIEELGGGSARCMIAENFLNSD